MRRSHLTIPIRPRVIQVINLNSAFSEFCDAVCRQSVCLLAIARLRAFVDLLKRTNWNGNTYRSRSVFTATTPGSAAPKPTAVRKIATPCWSRSFTYSIDIGISLSRILFKPECDRKVAQNHEGRFKDFLAFLASGDNAQKG